MRASQGAEEKLFGFEDTEKGDRVAAEQRAQGRTGHIEVRGLGKDFGLC